ncbi:MAG: ATP-binding protein [Thermodesulfovibrionales bacterium]
MLRSLQGKFLLLLLAVVAVGLSATFLLRELMVRDFREFLEGEMEDRVYWVAASLESSFEKNGGWRDDDVVERTVWALMLGMEIRLLDYKGNLRMDTDQAMERLSPLVKRRLAAISERRPEDEETRFVPYPLFLGGSEIGRLEVNFLEPRKESLFVSRSNRFLLISLVALGGLAMLLGVVFARKMTGPIRKLTSAASEISQGNLSSSVDISTGDEIQRLAETFNRMARNLVTQEALRRKLTSNIAHELRTPLSAIRGELEGMMDGLIPVRKESLQSLYAETGRLRTILDGIAELSRAEASSLTLKKEPVGLGEFLGNITGRFSSVFAEKGVSLALDCPEGLTAQADPDKLSQIVINLLSNALKATERGGRVTLRAFPLEGGSAIEVSDTGRGIGTEDLPFVFERFYRASEGGLGIGLTIVKELVEAHGGAISARSEPGKGSTFTVTFPAVHNLS